MSSQKIARMMVLQKALPLRAERLDFLRNQRLSPG